MLCGFRVKHTAESSLPSCRAQKKMRDHTEREDQLSSEGYIFEQISIFSLKLRRQLPYSKAKH